MILNSIYAKNFNNIFVCLPKAKLVIIQYEAHGALMMIVVTIIVAQTTTQHIQSGIESVWSVIECRFLQFR